MQSEMDDFISGYGYGAVVISTFNVTGRNRYNVDNYVNTLSEHLYE